MDNAAFVVSLVAVVFAVAAVVYTRRQTLANERATAILEAQEARYRAPWRLERRQRGSLNLINDGDEPVYGIEIEPPPNGRLIVEDGSLDVLTSGSAIAITAVLAWGGGTSITVTWSRSPGGERHEWSMPVPPTP